MRNPLPGIIAEVRKVTFPTPQQLLSYLFFTVALTGLFALVMLGLDVIFLEIREILLDIRL